MSKIENGLQVVRQLTKKVLPLAFLIPAYQPIYSQEITTTQPNSAVETQLLVHNEPNLIEVLAKDNAILGINRRSIVTTPEANRWSVVKGEFRDDTLVLKPVHTPDFKVNELSGYELFDVALGDRNQGIFTKDGGKTWQNIAPFAESGQNIQTHGLVVLPGENRAIAQIQIDSNPQPSFRSVDQSGNVHVLPAQIVPSKAQYFATPAYKVDNGYLVFSNFEPVDINNGPKNSFIVNKVTADGLVQSLIQINDPQATKIEILSSDVSDNGHINLVLTPKTADPTQNPNRIIRYDVTAGTQIEIATVQPSSSSAEFMKIQGTFINTLAGVSDKDDTCILTAAISKISETNFSEDVQAKCYSNANPQTRKIFNDLGDWRDGTGKLVFMDNNGQKSLVIAYQDRSVVTKTIGDLTKPDNQPWKKAVFAPPAYQSYIPVAGNVPLK